MVGLATSCSYGAIWESPRWALNADLATEIAYDSNLYLRSDGPADGTLIVDPKATFYRRLSATQMMASLDVRAVTFFSRSGNNSLDPKLAFLIRRPSEFISQTPLEVAASWARVTEAQADVGRLVGRYESKVAAQSAVISREKLEIPLGVVAEQQDYLERGLYTNQSLTLGASSLYRQTERRSWGIHFEVGWKEAKPDSGAATSLRSFNQNVTLGGQGEFSPKLSGSLFIGLSHVAYPEGARSDRDEVVGNSRLEWKFDTLTTWSVQGSRSVYFSSFGDAVLGSKYELGFVRRFRDAYGLRISGGYQRKDFEQGGADRRDRFWFATIGLRYQLTQRLAATASVENSDQRSTDYIYRYNRTRISLQSTWHF